MAYQISGQALKAERSEKYIGMYVAFKVSMETDPFDGPIVNRDMKIVTSKKQADRLVNEGYAVEDILKAEDAAAFCKEWMSSISGDVTEVPREGWQKYFNRTYGPSPFEKIVEGEIELWKDTTAYSWFTFRKEGGLEATFSYDSRNGWQANLADSRVGTKISTGYHICRLTLFEKMSSTIGPPAGA